MHQTLMFHLTFGSSRSLAGLERANNSLIWHQGRMYYTLCPYNPFVLRISCQTSQSDWTPSQNYPRRREGCRCYTISDDIRWLLRVKPTSVIQSLMACCCSLFRFWRICEMKNSFLSHCTAHPRISSNVVLISAQEDSENSNTLHVTSNRWANQGIHMV